MLTGFLAGLYKLAALCVMPTHMATHAASNGANLALSRVLDADTTHDAGSSEDNHMDTASPAFYGKWMHQSTHVCYGGVGSLCVLLQICGTRIALVGCFHATELMVT